jgi:hypothetical protein
MPETFSTIWISADQRATIFLQGVQISETLTPLTLNIRNSSLHIRNCLFENINFDSLPVFSVEDHSKLNVDNTEFRYLFFFWILTSRYLSRSSAALNGSLFTCLKNIETVLKNIRLFQLNAGFMEITDSLPTNVTSLSTENTVIPLFKIANTTLNVNNSIIPSCKVRFKELSIRENQHNNMIIKVNRYFSS